MKKKKLKQTNASAYFSSVPDQDPWRQSGIEWLGPMYWNWQKVLGGFNWYKKNKMADFILGTILYCDKKS